MDNFGNSIWDDCPRERLIWSLQVYGLYDWGTEDFIDPYLNTH